MYFNLIFPLKDLDLSIIDRLACYISIYLKLQIRGYVLGYIVFFLFIKRYTYINVNANKKMRRKNVQFYATSNTGFISSRKNEEETEIPYDF